MKQNDRQSRRLVHGGICPVCDEPFTDGYDEIEAGESYEARICVTEKDGKDEGKMLVHLGEGDDDEE